MIIFSEITCRADTTTFVSKGFVGGEPICYEDFSGWRIFEDFLKECKGPSKVLIEVQTYGYGEGPEQWEASPEEVAYMIERVKGNPRFLETKCIKTRKSYKVDIRWEPNEIWPELEESLEQRWEFFGNDDDLGCSYCCPECRHQVPEEDFWSSDMQTFKPFTECPKCGIKLKV